VGQGASATLERKARRNRVQVFDAKVAVQTIVIED
jgi:hypothetical protein